MLGMPLPEGRSAMGGAATETLDATGLRCPLPVLRARKRLRGMAPGTLLEVLTDDPVSPIDMRFFCETEGHRIVETETTEPPYRFLIERTCSAP